MHGQLQGFGQLCSRRRQLGSVRPACRAARDPAGASCSSCDPTMPTLQPSPLLPNRRDYMMATRGIKDPEMVIAVSAHAAFIKAAGAAAQWLAGAAAQPPRYLPVGACPCFTSTELSRVVAKPAARELVHSVMSRPFRPVSPNSAHLPQSTTASAWCACQWAATTASQPRRWPVLLGPTRCWWRRLHPASLTDWWTTWQTSPRWGELVL